MVPPEHSRDTLCTYLYCDDNDRKGFVTGYLGRMQYALDKQLLVEKGYQVVLEKLSTESLHRALTQSSAIVLRGHGEEITSALNQCLEKLDNLLLSTPPTLIFQACSVAAPPYEQNTQSMLEKLSTLAITQYFAAEQDYVASMYRFDNENRIIGVDYIP